MIRAKCEILPEIGGWWLSIQEFNCNYQYVLVNFSIRIVIRVTVVEDKHGVAHEVLVAAVLAHVQLVFDSTEVHRVAYDVVVVRYLARGRV